MLTPALKSSLEAELDVTVRRAARVGGGSINDGYAVELSDGRKVFVKSHAQAPPGMFAAEARGLAWLREARALRVPEVIAVGGGSMAEPAFLVLEYLEPARPAARFDEQLGIGLAALHRAGAATFGLDHDNFIGSLPQSNAPTPDWPTFLRDRRLAPLVRRATDAGRLSERARGQFDRLLANVQAVVGPAEPPVRLHGDLWGGNVHTDGSGNPCLIDPAVYGGHREVDLAMMRLFGGIAQRTFEAYVGAWPLAPGSERRIPLYQLYPLLVHVCLFGAGYVAPLEAALADTLKG